MISGQAGYGSSSKISHQLYTRSQHLTVPLCVTQRPVNSWWGHQWGSDMLAHLGAWHDGAACRSLAIHGGPRKGPKAGSWP